MDVLAACLSLVAVGMVLGMLASAVLPGALRQWQSLLEWDAPAASVGAAGGHRRQAGTETVDYAPVPVRVDRPSRYGRAGRAEAAGWAARPPIDVTAARQMDGSWRVET